MKNNKVKIVFDCDIKKCPIGSNPEFDCKGFCDRAKLCTSDGMVITKIMDKKSNITYNVGNVSGDEFIFAPEHPRAIRGMNMSLGGLISMNPDTDEFSKRFDIIETQYDYREYSVY